MDADGEMTTLVSEKRVKRPNIVRQLFDGFSWVDAHDHYRQGILHSESF